MRAQTVARGNEEREFSERFRHPREAAERRPMAPHPTPAPLRAASASALRLPRATKTHRFTFVYAPSNKKPRKRGLRGLAFTGAYLKASMGAFSRANAQLLHALRAVLARSLSSSLG